MPTSKEIEAVKSSIGKLSGGHSLENMSGDVLWQTRAPINITKLLESAEKVRETDVGTRDL